MSLLKKIAKKIFKAALLFIPLLLIASSGWAAGPKPPSAMSNPFVVTMVIIMFMLALVIGLLANLVLGAAYVHEDNEKKEEKEKKIPAAASTAAMLAGLLLLSPALFAQDSNTSAPVNVINGVSPVAFYMITGVIFLELLVVAALLYNLRILLNIQRGKKAKAETAAAYKPRINWWDKLNKFRPLEQEVTIDLGHDYDGIRELDNRLPPWWLYGFYCTILFACVYLWRYHVSHTAPLSGEEFQIAMRAAAAQREEYLKKAANNVDETNVKLLTAEPDLASGKNVFQTMCAACHGKLGEGGVGPNLTDDYWLHGGDIKDVFKTIKYGWPEKGMKSWKDDYSPSQIAQIASYVKSLHGTNPPNGKAPQGTIYSAGQGAPTDSTAKSLDSLKKLAAK